MSVPVDLSIAARCVYPSIPLEDFTVSADGTTYTSWSYSQAQPTQAQINQAWLDYRKDLKRHELTLDYDDTLLSGFSSTALGSTYNYGFSPSDQDAWKGLKAAIDLGAFPPGGYSLKCWVTSGSAQYLSHTQTQATQVLKDGSTFGLNQVSNLRTKMGNVNAVLLSNYATAQAAFDAVDTITY